MICVPGFACLAGKWRKNQSTDGLTCRSPRKRLSLRRPLHEQACLMQNLCILALHGRHLAAFILEELSTAFAILCQGVQGVAKQPCQPAQAGCPKVLMHVYHLIRLVRTKPAIIESHQATRSLVGGIQIQTNHRQSIALR